MADPIHIPHWRGVALHSGTLREVAADRSRLVLWVPGEREGNGQQWLRISTMHDAPVVQQQGLSAIAATAIQARQQLRGALLGDLLRRFRRHAEDLAWMLPTGEAVQQCGERQTELLLVWKENQEQPLDEAQIHQRWPQATRVQSLGPCLFLVWGATAPVAGGEAKMPLPLKDVYSLPQAERWLADARRGGDRTGEASALTDLGLLALEDGNPSLAITRLKEALALARALGDRARQGDILGNMGLALLEAGRPDEARQHLEQALILVRAVDDRFTEKLVLERLAAAWVALGEMPTTLSLLDEALTLARTLGDRQHEAEILWHLGIRWAELGQRERAIDYGQAAVRLWQALGKPQARVYAEHLQQYQRGGALDGMTAGSLVTTTMAGPAISGPMPPIDRAGPGCLQMAISAARAISRFVGSGFKTVTMETLEERTRRCARCKYHTGLRCRVCGCFTNLKTRLPHEECPLGEWSSVALTSRGGT